MQLKILWKTKFGKVWGYPQDVFSKAILQVSRRKAFTVKDIKQLKAAGFVISESELVAISALTKRKPK